MANKIGHFVRYRYKIPGDVEKFGNKPGKFTMPDAARIIKRIGRPRAIVKEEHYRVYSVEVMGRSTRTCAGRETRTKRNETSRSLGGTVRTCAITACYAHAAQTWVFTLRVYAYTRTLAAARRKQVETEGERAVALRSDVLTKINSRD